MQRMRVVIVVSGCPRPLTGSRKAQTDRVAPMINIDRRDVALTNGLFSARKAPKVARKRKLHAGSANRFRAAMVAIDDLE